MPARPNIAVKANIWCDPHMTRAVESPEFLAPKLTGDLLVHFLGTRDVRVIERELSRRQFIEYKQARFFQNHGQIGTAFTDLPPKQHRA